MVVVQKKLERGMWTNAVLGLIPDLAIAWAVASYTDSGPMGFLFTLAALIAVYIAIWLKNTAWGWLIYWLGGRRQLITHIDDFLVTNHFPRPPEFIGGAEDYLRQITDNEEADGKHRAQAGFELGTMQGFRSAGKFQHLLRVMMAFEEAIQRYGRRFSGAPVAEDRTQKPNLSEANEATITMRKVDLDTISWLADWGLRFWTYRPAIALRSGAQLPYDRAEEYSALLDAFERKSVPNLLLESEEDKEQRFTSHENRFKNLWDWYPEHAK